LLRATGALAIFHLTDSQTKKDIYEGF